MEAKRQRLAEGVPTKEEALAVARQACLGMSRQDWSWLCRYDELLKNLYVVVDWPIRAVVADRSLNLPWSFALLLGSYAKKHVFASKGQMDPKALRRASRNFCSHVRWAWRFRDADDDLENTRLVKRDPRACEGLVAPEVDLRMPGSEDLEMF